MKTTKMLMAVIINLAIASCGKKEELISPSKTTSAERRVNPVQESARQMFDAIRELARNQDAISPSKNDVKLPYGDRMEAEKKEKQQQAEFDKIIERRKQAEAALEETGPELLKALRNYHEEMLSRNVTLSMAMTYGTYKNKTVPEAEAAYLEITRMSYEEAVTYGEIISKSATATVHE